MSKTKRKPARPRRSKPTPWSETTATPVADVKRIARDVMPQPPAVPPYSSGIFGGAFNGRVVKSVAIMYREPGGSGPMQIVVTFVDGSWFTVVTERAINGAWLVDSPVCKWQNMTFVPVPAAEGKR